MAELSALATAERHTVLVTDQPAAILFRFTDRLYRASNIREVYPAALDAIMSAMGCSRAAILLTDQDSVMRFVACHGLSKAYRAAVEGHTPWSMDDPDPSPVYISDVATADLDPVLKAVVLGEHILSVCFIPLVIEGRLIGKFMAYQDAPEGFTDDERSLGLIISRQLAFSIERQTNALKTREAEVALRRADRRKDEFLAILSHELRNPIGAISVAVELIRQQKATEQVLRDAREVIGRQTVHLSRLVDDLLDTVRISQGRLELRLEPVQLGEVLRTAQELTKPLLDEKHQTLVLAPPEQQIQIIADAARLAQALSNLISNASRYSGERSTIWVESRVLPALVEVVVQDEGIGIPAEFLPRIFDMHSREEHAVLPSAGGLGIGLNLVKRLVDLHGGMVEAASPGPGQGSSFTVRLPRQD